MQNPCYNCKKANIEDVFCFEYGCCDPCQEAKKYFEEVGTNIDDLLVRVRKLLGEKED